jgi:hypothetical protein
MNIIGSLIIAYGLSETQFSNALAFLLPTMVFLAAVVNGIAIPMRTTFMKAVVGFSVSSERSILGVIFAVTFYSVWLAVMYFLFNVAERHEQDKRGVQEI